MPSTDLIGPTPLSLTFYRYKPPPKFLANPFAVPPMRASSCSKRDIDRDRDRWASPNTFTFAFARELHTLAASYRHFKPRGEGMGRRRAGKGTVQTILSAVKKSVQSFMNIPRTACNSESITVLSRWTRAVFISYRCSSDTCHTPVADDCRVPAYARIVTYFPIFFPLSSPSGLKINQPTFITAPPFWAPLLTTYLAL